MDFLARWIQRLNNTNFLSPPFPQCKACLLYADDTLLLIKPNRNEILKARLIFDIFAKLSGLKINLAKSELAITTADLPLTQNLAAIIQCRPVPFPIKYLGLPLSHKRLTKTDLSPLLDKMQKALTGWKASLLSIGGRIVMTNAVLSAIPQYLMSVCMLPKWLTRKIDQIRRRFLWHGHKSQQNQQKGIYMVTWTSATMPKHLGGLGIRNINLANQALLLKWIWQWYCSDNAWWKSATAMENVTFRPWEDTAASPFWKDIGRVAPIFNCSVTHKIGNGTHTRFWHDRWGDSIFRYDYPNLYRMTSDRYCSVQHCIANATWLHSDLSTNPDAVIERHNLLAHIQTLHLTQQSDTVHWIRASAGFSCASAYKFLAHTPAPLSEIANLWQIKAPLRVLVFAWLLLKNRLTTTDNLVRRGWCLPSICLMCAMEEETANHLFWTCRLATDIRSYVSHTFQPQHLILSTPAIVNPTQLLTDSDAMMILRQIELTTCFILWRERCRRMFSDKYQSPVSLVREIKVEFKAWFTGT